VLIQWRSENKNNAKHNSIKTMHQNPLLKFIIWLKHILKFYSGKVKVQSFLGLIKYAPCNANVCRNECIVPYSWGNSPQYQFDRQLKGSGESLEPVWMTWRRRDFWTPTVKEEIHCYSSQYSAHLSTHPNDLVVNLMAQPDNNRRLRKHLPYNMTTNEHSSTCHCISSYTIC
jgi:hypothetical protein